jgi:hypothetical protein
LALPGVWLAVTLTDIVRVLYEKIDFSSLRLVNLPDYIKAWPLIGEKLHLVDIRDREFRWFAREACSSTECLGERPPAYQR